MMTDKTLQEKISVLFHQMEHSKALEERIYEKAHHLLKLHNHILNCHITVDNPHHHKTKGNLYQIRLNIKLPGEELIVNKQPGGRLETHTDPYIAVNDAFTAAANLLQKKAEKVNDARVI